MWRCQTGRYEVNVCDRTAPTAAGQDPLSSSPSVILKGFSFGSLLHPAAFYITLQEWVSGLVSYQCDHLSSFPPRDNNSAWTGMRSIWSDGCRVIFPLPVTAESLCLSVCLSVCLSGQCIQWDWNTHSTSGIHTILSNTISTFPPLLLSDSRLIPTCHMTCRDIYPLYKQHVTYKSVIKILPFSQFALCVLLIVRQRQKKQSNRSSQTMRK